MAEKLDGNQKTTEKPRIIGLEVWTGHAFNQTQAVGAKLVHVHPTAYYSINDEGIVEIGSDGYPGGTHWIRYEDGATHAYLENAIRRVVWK